MTTTQTPSKLIGLVTDSTPAMLEYGDYRGYVVIDAETGEWECNLTEDEVGRLTPYEDLGDPIYSEEYDDLRPVLRPDALMVTRPQIG